MSNELFRRQFLKAGVGFIGGTGSTVLFGDFAAVLAQSNGQNEWRYCGKCHGMFYNGYLNKGLCPAGSGHQAIGYNFVLPHDISGTPTTQNEWRYCGKCHGMFYNGYPDKGRCPAGSGHQAIGYNFVLPRLLDLVFYTRLERNQLGYWVYMKGEGFTPGGGVSFTVENLAGASGAKSIGIFATVKADGTFGTSPDVVWTGRTWSRGGTANLRAIDKATGQSITTSIPALY